MEEKDNLKETTNIQENINKNNYKWIAVSIMSLLFLIIIFQFFIIDRTDEKVEKYLKNKYNKEFEISLIEKKQSSTPTGIGCDGSEFEKKVSGSYEYYYRAYDNEENITFYITAKNNNGKYTFKDSYQSSKKMKDIEEILKQNSYNEFANSKIDILGNSYYFITSTKLTVNLKTQSNDELIEKYLLILQNLKSEISDYNTLYFRDTYKKPNLEIIIKFTDKVSVNLCYTESGLSYELSYYRNKNDTKTITIVSYDLYKKRNDLIRYIKNNLNEDIINIDTNYVTKQIEIRIDENSNEYKIEKIKKCIEEMDDLINNYHKTAKKLYNGSEIEIKFLFSNGEYVIWKSKGGYEEKVDNTIYYYDGNKEEIII